MAGKRLTPEEDFERLAERIWNSYGKTINDYESFSVAFNDYMEDEISGIENVDTLKRKTFNAIRRKHKDVVKRSVFKDAGGKSLKRDRDFTADEVVDTEKEYIEKGARKVDLRHYDTKRITPKRTFRKIGYIKKRIVYSRPTTVRIGKKDIIRYRDRKGRFVRIKK